MLQAQGWREEEEEGEGGRTSHARPTTSCIATNSPPNTSARAHTLSVPSVQTFSHPWPEWSE